MEEKLIKCKECETLNETDYKYCKNCGAVLQKEESNNSDSGSYAATGNYNTAGQGYYNAPFPLPTEIDGINTDELTAFVGKNGYKFVPKWSVMSATHRSVSWCWPVFLLTFFFGIFGAAFWFLYRKMYKLGAILLAAAVVFAVAQAALSFSSTKSLLGDYYTLIENYTDSMNDTQLEKDVENIILGKDTAKLMVISNTFRILTIILSVVLALFAYDIYRRFCVTKIRTMDRKLSDSELSFCGGTSGGGLALGIVAMVIVNMMVSVAMIIGVL